MKRYDYTEVSTEGNFLVVKGTMTQGNLIENIGVKVPLHKLAEVSTSIVTKEADVIAAEIELKRVNLANLQGQLDVLAQTIAVLEVEITDLEERL